jgi:predicted AAA+ superfamily ATPase
MKPFHTIAVPHRDILEGRLTMDVFAADLWEVFKGRGADEYKDQELFFQKTYQTEGLKHLSAIVEKCLLCHCARNDIVMVQVTFNLTLSS